MTQVQADRLALIAKRSKRPLDHVIEEFEERAAIRQYEGGKPRKEAEVAALNDVADVFLRRA